MNTLNMVFLGVLGISWAIIVILSVKLKALKSEVETLKSKTEVTDEEIEQLGRDVAWLEEMKKKGKVY